MRGSGFPSCTRSAISRQSRSKKTSVSHRRRLSVFTARMIGSLAILIRKITLVIDSMHSSATV